MHVGVLGHNAQEVTLQIYFSHGPVVVDTKVNLPGFRSGVYSSVQALKVRQGS